MYDSDSPTESYSGNFEPYDNHPSSSSQSMAPVRNRRSDVDPDDPLYKEKRRKNNEAVMKSRQKAKNKTIEMTARVDKLKNDNQNLVTQIDRLQEDLKNLKQMFMEQAGSASHGVTFEQLNRMLTECTELEVDSAVERLVSKVDVPSHIYHGRVSR